MGKPNSSQSDQNSFTHFSHPHPLHLTTLQTSGPIPVCSACELTASGSVYTCKSCNFLLHPKCYQLPRKIKHAFHQTHTLFLQPKPVYPEGVFNCDACGNRGSGFSYHCSFCGLDLHTTCASLPLQLTHRCHHHHQLGLEFVVPYNGNTFSCDVCRRVGANTWIYRCSTCAFDVHLTCVATVIPVSSLQPALSFNSPPNMAAYGGAPAVQPVVAQNQFGGNPYNNLNGQVAYGAGRPANGPGIGDQLLVGAVNGIASGVAQSTTQVLLEGLLGGGGGGGVMDGGSYHDGGYGGAEGGYSGGDAY